MAAVHTPGSWEAVCEDLRGGKCWSIVSGGSAEYIMDGIHESLNGEANTKLMAAAPDLLSALKRAVTILERLDAPRHLDARFPALDAARAAIAKAEGVSV